MAERTCTTPGCGGEHSAKGLCKRCYRRKWHADHADHEREASARWWATHPGRRRQLFSEWYAANATPEFLARKAEESNAYYRANREEISERRRVQRSARIAAETPAEREARLIKRRARYRAKPEHYRAKATDYVHSRIARQRGGVVTSVDFKALLAEHGMVCHICGLPIESRADMHFDHVIPLSRGGAHSAENIRPAHAFCNLSKGAKTA